VLHHSMLTGALGESSFRSFVSQTAEGASGGDAKVVKDSRSRKRVAKEVQELAHNAVFRGFLSSSFDYDEGITYEYFCHE